jgi:hypothetical protein
MTDPDCCLIAGFSAAAPAQIVHAPYAYAQDAIDQNKADKFNKHVLTHPPGDKAYACFMRRYDAEHLARHRKQKVGAINVALSKDGKSAIIHLERIVMWRKDKPDDAGALLAGADDQIFRLDREDAQD